MVLATANSSEVVASTSDGTESYAPGASGRREGRRAAPVAHHSGTSLLAVLPCPRQPTAWDGALVVGLVQRLLGQRRPVLDAPLNPLERPVTPLSDESDGLPSR